MSQMHLLSELGVHILSMGNDMQCSLLQVCLLSYALVYILLLFYILGSVYLLMVIARRQLSYVFARLTWPQVMAVAHNLRMPNGE